MSNVAPNTPNRRVTLKGEVLAEIVRGNPGQKIKSVEYGQYGDIRRIEWYENDPETADASDSPFPKPRMEQLR